jgi:ABC-type nitrate/sulfonate/bicarbonate transport system substrate-binding protein
MITKTLRVRVRLRALRSSSARIALPVAIAMMAIQAVPQATAADLTKVKVGNPSSLLHLPYYVAIEEGYFARHGLAIDNVTTFQWVPAIVSGDVNFATASPDALVISASKGKPVPTIVTQQQNNTVAISASTRLKLPNLAKGYPENLRDLKGAAIAVPNLGTGNESLLKQAFATIGFQNGRDYSMVALGAGPNMIAALKAGKVDAVTLWPPFNEQIWADKTAVPLVQEGKGEGPESTAKGVGTNIVVNEAYGKANPAVVRSFIAAMVDATAFVRDAKKNMPRLIAIADKYSAGLPDKASMEAGITTVASLAYPGVSCRSWQLVGEGLKAIDAIQTIPSCDVMIDPAAPKGPLGPGGK